MDSNGKVKLKGKQISGYDSEIEVDIGSANVADYEVVSKPIPEPTKITGGTITWFNAFGVKHKKTGDEAKIVYTVTLQELPTGKTKLFALVANTPQEVDFKAAGNGKIKFSLSAGDPPLGYFP